MTGEPMPDALPEARRNALLRRVDWRFLLRQQEVPRTADLRSGGPSEALKLISAPAPSAPGSADLAVLGFPRRGALRAARGVLRPGGEVVCEWRLPMPGGPARARRRLERAGFTDVRIYWSGPLPHRLPQFWLSVDSPDAVAHLFATRPPRSHAQATLRPLWRWISRAGLLAPLCAVAQAPRSSDDAADSRDEVADLLTPGTSWVLLTGGHRSINKVVGLPIEAGVSEPAVVVKFARVPEAEPNLDREARVLRALETERPEIAGIPRLRGRGRRAGRLAVAESPVQGESLLSVLAPATFGELARRVTRFLIELAGSGAPQPAAGWWLRLVGEPLEEFERRFGAVLEPGTVQRARRLLEGLGDLPLVCEHRDCSPWNVVLTASGAPALLDWESAELRGLPGLDLIYFLANAVFVLDGSLESGRTRESYVRLLDASTAYSHVAAICIEEYSARLGIDAETFRRLRILCWIVHCGSEYRHLEMEAVGAPAAGALEGGVFLGLLEEELRRDQDAL